MAIKNPPQDKSIKSPPSGEREFHFPNEGITVTAKTLEEAEKKCAKMKGKK